MSPEKDYDNAKELGSLITDIKYIRERIDDLKIESSNERSEFNERITELEKFRDSQKAYIAAAIFIGGVVVWLVDLLIKLYNSIRR